ncbi:MAG: anthranilate synthase component I family protein, partial [Myxococcota bacterium]
ELGRRFVDLPQREAPGNQPLGIEVLLDSALVVDHQESRWTVLGERETALHLALLGSAPDVAHAPLSNTVDFYPASADSEHEANVRLAQAYIGLGEVYQANVTRRIRVDGVATGVEAHIALATQNPVAHGCYLRAQGIELISNSMETLLTYAPDSRMLSSFPIKGTRARASVHEPGATEVLRSDPKERAEHVMIVDLVRNDLGRVCDAGSVVVPELMDVEGYRGVWHGVSRVQGRLREDATLGDAVAAVFPGGSITGAPKRRSVEVLDRIEREGRGFYTGSIGLLGPAGELSMSILIRTLVRDDRGWSIGVGGGIVADSVPSNEVEEARTKIRVFEDVLGGRVSVPAEPSGQATDGAEHRESRRLATGSALSL